MLMLTEPVVDIPQMVGLDQKWLCSHKPLTGT